MLSRWSRALGDLLGAIENWRVRNPARGAGLSCCVAVAARGNRRRDRCSWWAVMMATGLAVVAGVGCRVPAKVAPASVSGVVLTPGGTPPAKAVVSWRERNQVGGTDAGISGRKGQSRCDGAGRFKVEDLQPGSYVFSATAPGFDRATDMPLLLQPGEPLDITVQLAPLQALQGLVLDHVGQPVPDATVVVWPAGGPRNGETKEGTTDAEGLFSVQGLARGAWNVLATAPGLGTDSVVDVQVPGDLTEIRMTGVAGRFKGTVLRSRQNNPGEVWAGGPGLRTPGRSRLTPMGHLFSRAWGRAGTAFVRCQASEPVSRPLSSILVRGPFPR